MLARLIAMARRQVEFRVPRVIWFWLVWAVLEVLVWMRSPEPRLGQGEIRHLLLLAGMFVVLPSLGGGADCCATYGAAC